MAKESIHHRHLFVVGHSPLTASVVSHFEKINSASANGGIFYQSHQYNDDDSLRLPFKDLIDPIIKCVNEIPFSQAVVFLIVLGSRPDEAIIDLVNGVIESRFCHFFYLLPGAVEAYIQFIKRLFLPEAAPYLMGNSCEHYLIAQACEQQESKIKWPDR